MIFSRGIALSIISCMVMQTLPARAFATDFSAAVPGHVSYRTEAVNPRMVWMRRQVPTRPLASVQLRASAHQIRDEVVITGANIKHENRIALVLDGGVSLCMYIYGIVTELYAMVRATATDPNDESKLYIQNPRSTERVYRKVAHALSKHGVGQDKSTLTTRLIIDIISGTSAGGINGVFLAKALAFAQPLTGLESLWINEGDIASLLNDAPSMTGTLPDGSTYTLDPKAKKLAVLNGNRMYAVLVGAYEQMDSEQPRPDDFVSPYVHRLDLSVTTTDILGIPERTFIQGAEISDRLYRNKFSLMYRRELGDAGPWGAGDNFGHRNDFVRRNNALLAFASRSTSAVPGAFQPSRAKDVPGIVKRMTGYRTPQRTNDIGADPTTWAAFFPNYYRVAHQQAAQGDSRPAESVNFLTASFGDGAYLNNEPIDNATDLLITHWSSVPMDRMLMIVQPSPEAPKNTVSRKMPNVVQNAVAALITIPGHQSNLKNLQAIEAKNELVRQIKKLTGKLEEGLRVATGEPAVAPTMKAQDWRDATLVALQRQRGEAYAYYHHFRMMQVTEEFGLLLTKAAGFDARSQEAGAIRTIVSAWVEETYSPNGAPGANDNTFLYDFDLGYSFRRLFYTRGKITDLSCLDGDAKKLVEYSGQRWPTDDELNDFEKEIIFAKGAFGDIFRRMNAARGALSSPDGILHTLVTDAKAPVVTLDDLRQVMSAQTETEKKKAAQAIVDAKKPQLDAFASELAIRYRLIQDQVTKEASDALDDTARPEGRAIAQRVLQHYYAAFGSYDQVTLPILFASSVGELSTVKIARISPLDANAIHDTTKGPKLNGAAVFHFGAFLSKKWRINDIRWGRLDGAERIIASLLPDEVHRAVKNELILEAHLAILEDIINENPNDQTLINISKSIQQKKGESVDPKAMIIPLSAEDLLDYYKNDFVLDQSLDRHELTKTIARLFTILGDVFSGIGANAVRLLGRLAWTVIEIGVPWTQANFIFIGVSVAVAAAAVVSIVTGYLVPISYGVLIGLSTAHAVLYAIHRFVIEDEMSAASRTRVLVTLIAAAGIFTSLFAVSESAVLHTVWTHVLLPAWHFIGRRLVLWRSGAILVMPSLLAAA